MKRLADAETRRKLLWIMILSRAFDDRLAQLAAEKDRVPGMQILSTGQEAVAAGVVMALRPEDVIVSNHRSHAHLLARGADPGALLAEIMGKVDGVNRGKSGALHLIVPEVNALMTSTVVGAGPPMAAGAAFAQQYRGEDAVTVTFFGDGAAAEGSVHEAMNLAGVWKLPLLFVCENNCWAGAQPLSVHCSAGAIASRANSYGMPGEMANGNDADDVYETASRLIEGIRAGNGPALLEAMTYRMRGHGEHDHQSYVDKEELAFWAERDPVSTFSRRLEQEGVIAAQEIEAMRREADRAVADALAFADRSPYPPPREALLHVWSENPWARPLQGGNEDA